MVIFISAIGLSFYLLASRCSLLAGEWTRTSGQKLRCLLNRTTKLAKSFFRETIILISLIEGHTLLARVGQQWPANKSQSPLFGRQATLRRQTDRRPCRLNENNGRLSNQMCRLVCQITDNSGGHAGSNENNTRPFRKYRQTTKANLLCEPKSTAAPRCEAPLPRWPKSRPQLFAWMT